MTDVLLIYPPYAWPRKHPPLGLAYLAACLERSGYRVKIIDMSPLGMTIRQLGRLLKKERFRLAGISFMTPQAPSARAVASVIKEIDRRRPVVVGGPHASAVPKEMLADPNIDFVVRGEGEITFTELTTALFSGRSDFAEIRGIVYREEGEARMTAARELVADLDALPLPAWHLLPNTLYSVPQAGRASRQTVFTILSSRGCPNYCIFCDSHTVFGRQFRQRSAENIFSEMRYLKERFAATQFDFVDDLITVDRGRVKELCDRLVTAGWDVRWMCNARVNTVDFEMLSWMRAAGCEAVDFGVESGDERVLKKINKKITLDDIRNAHRWARQAGLTTSTFLMVGNLGEDFASVAKSAALVDEIDSDSPSVAVATPFPGTALYRTAKAHGWLLETDWSKYVTSPHTLPGYKPVMRTDAMTRPQIMEAYFFLNSRIMKKKFRTKYGKNYFLNFSFYRDTIFTIRSVKDFLNKLKVVWKLAAHRFSLPQSRR